MSAPWWHRLRSDEQRVVALYLRHTPLWRVLKSWWLSRCWSDEILAREEAAYAASRTLPDCDCRAVTLIDVPREGNA